MSLRADYDMKLQISNLEGQRDGLKKYLSQRNSQLSWKCEQHENAVQIALEMLHECGGNVFVYAEKNKLRGQANGMSHIGDYTNKQGKTSKAHFNPNGNWIAFVRVKGDKPIPCTYWTKISEDKFTFNGKEFVAI